MAEIHDPPSVAGLLAMHKDRVAAALSSAAGNNGDALSTVFADAYLPPSTASEMRSNITPPKNHLTVSKRVGDVYPDEKHTLSFASKVFQSTKSWVLKNPIWFAIFIGIALGLLWGSLAGALVPVKSV